MFFSLENDKKSKHFVMTLLKMVPMIVEQFFRHKFEIRKMINREKYFYILNFDDWGRMYRVEKN